MIVDDAGKRMFVCSDSDYCHERRGDHEFALPAPEASDAREGESA
jgi:alpha-D-ribose 1-methylphosphonate 5-phosphate C-P lyase